MEAELTVAAEAIFGIKNGGIENRRSWTASPAMLPGIVIGNPRLPALASPGQKAGGRHRPPSSSG